MLAGDVITTGSNNTLLGYGSDPSAVDATNQIVIGKGATGVGDNYAVIGNADVTRVYAAQDAGATLYAAGLNIGGTAVTSTAAELNLVDGSSAGTIVNSKGVVYGSSGEVNATTLQIAGTSITANAAELNYVDGVTSNIQTQLDAKGTASNVTGLSDALVESNSIYIGNDPSSTTDTANNNIGLGISALQNITTGDNNTALGSGTLKDATTAEGNVAIGINAMQNNISGGKNIAISPYRALNALTTGQQNIAIGMDAVRDITDASYNIGIGTYALSANTSGNYNLALGYRAMAGTGTGDFNSAYGYDALRSLTSGASNIGIGKDAGDLITTGSNNIIIGNNAHASAVDVSNEIVIGAGANGLGANYAVIGSADVTRVYAAEDGAAVIYANGTINSSDSRFKSKVKPMNLGLQFINKLNPVSYFKMSKSQYKGEEDNNDLRYEYGLIAQEVEEVLKETDPENTVVTKDDEGFLGMDYKQIIMPLIKSVQELSSYVEELESNKSDEIQALKKEIELLKSMIKSQK